MGRPLYVTFSSQKGGIGKSTLGVCVASYLHFVKGYNVAVIDCDYPQHSIASMRLREIDIFNKDEYYKKKAFLLAQEIGKKSYDVISSTPETGIELAEKLFQLNPKLDIIFFDMAGTVNNISIIQLLSSMDYIFTPISADRLAMESSLTFASTINDKLIGTNRSKIKGLYLLWNFVDGREKTNLYEIYENIIAELGLTILNTSIPDSKRFRKGLEADHKAIFKSTIFPPDKSYMQGSNLEELVNEIEEIIKS